MYGKLYKKQIAFIYLFIYLFIYADDQINTSTAIENLLEGFFEAVGWDTSLSKYVMQKKHKNYLYLFNFSVNGFEGKN